MEKSNIITVAWTGVINTNPAMVYISVRPERYSYNIIKQSGEFVINLTNSELAYATDWCGVKTGAKVDKFKEMHLTKEKAKFVKCPMIKESPVSIECKVKEIKELGSHHMFVAEVQVMNIQIKQGDLIYQNVILLHIQTDITIVWVRKQENSVIQQPKRRGEKDSTTFNVML